MVDEATLQAPLDAEVNEQLTAGWASYDGDRQLAAGVIKASPDGRRAEVAFDAKGHKLVLRGLPSVRREPA
jgi:hypothetical protein